MLNGEWFDDESREKGSRDYNDKDDTCVEGLIKETLELLNDIDEVLGIRRKKERDRRIKECVQDFEMEMIERFIEEDSEYITVHISEVTHLAFVINNIISDKWWMNV